MASVSAISMYSPGQYIRGTADELFQEETSGLKAMIRSTAEVAVSNRSALADKLRGDTVTISEEARKLSANAGAEAADEEKSKTLDASQVLSSQKEKEETGADQVKSIRKQIEQVKKQLEEAKARLAQAQGGGNAQAASNGEEAPSDAAMQQSMAALSNAAEVEATQAEVEMLNQQLLVLNQQLLEAMSGGGSAGGTGTAGLGGTANGPGGQGERIEVGA